MELLRLQVLVCSGEECTKSEKLGLYNIFKTEIRKNNLEYEVELIKTKCLGLCDLGPVVIVYPGDIVYCNIKKDGIYAAMVLSETYKDFNDKKTLFIGFCETATGLAQSVFRNFEGDASYIHTTRENIPDIEPVLEFHEEHSHAKNHKIYALDEKVIKNAEKIILVDDEITTGKTIINIINQINERYGNTDFSVFTLLDWRDESSIDAYKKLELKLGKPIKVYSLLKGKVKLNGNFDFSKKAPLNNQNNDLQKKPYIKLRNFCMEDILDRDKNDHLLIKNHIKETGRFGITLLENKN